MDAFLGVSGLVFCKNEKWWRKYWTTKIV